MNIEALVEEYINLRSSLDEARKVYKDKEKEVKDSLAILETKLLDVSNDTGVESFKTSVGTAFRTTKSYATLEDVNARIKYAIDNNDYGLFTAHVSKQHVKELIEEGLAPSVFGVKYEEIQSIGVRKS